MRDNRGLSRPILLLVCGSVATAAAGWIAVVLIGLLEIGPTAIVGAVFAGFFGAACALPIAAIPAALLGGVLARTRIQRKIVWASVGAVAGLGCYALGHVFPGEIGNLVNQLSAPHPMQFAPYFAAAGAVGALLFRTLVNAFGDFDEVVDQAD